MNIFFINDIFYIINEYLTIESNFNLIVTCKTLYKKYNTNYDKIKCIKKINNHFTSLSKINLNYIINENLDIKNNILKSHQYFCKMYSHFKLHKNTFISDILVHYQDQEVNINNYLFELLISYCYFSSIGENSWNSLKSDDLSHLLIYANDYQIEKICKYIYIPIYIIKYAIEYKIEHRQNIKILFKYYFEKYLIFETSNILINDLINKMIIFNIDKDIVKFTKKYILEQEKN